MLPLPPTHLPVAFKPHNHHSSSRHSPAICDMPSEQSPAVRFQSPPTIDGEGDCTILTGEQDRPTSALVDAKLADIYPCARFQQIVGARPDNESIKFAPFNLFRLRVGHVLELLAQTAPKVWRSHYQAGNASSAPRAFCMWLKELGAPLPPLSGRKPEQGLCSGTRTQISTNLF